MNISFSKVSKTQSELQIEVPVEALDKYLDRAARELSEDLEIQGFRKGNAPRNIVEQKVGSAKLLNQAAEIATEASYLKALNAEIDSGSEEFRGKVLKDIVEQFSRYAISEVSILKLAQGNPFIYKIIFKMPFFDIAPDYKSIASKVRDKETKEVVVNEKEIEDTLKWLHKSYNKNRSNTENRNIEEPELNDEFAKAVGNFEGLEDLNKSVREGIQIEKEKKEKDRVRMSIIKGVLERSAKDIPSEVIDRETRSIEEEFKERISQMGIEFDEYLKKIGKKREDLESGWRDSARERIETSLTINAIADIENIKPSEEDVEAEAQKVLARFSTIKEAKKGISVDRIKEYVYNALRNEKTLEFLESI